MTFCIPLLDPIDFTIQLDAVQLDGTFLDFLYTAKIV